MVWRQLIPVWVCARLVSDILYGGGESTKAVQWHTVRDIAWKHETWNNFILLPMSVGYFQHLDILKKIIWYCVSEAGLVKWLPGTPHLVSPVDLKSACAPWSMQPTLVCSKPYCSAAYYQSPWQQLLTAVMTLTSLGGYHGGEHWLWAPHDQI